MLEVLSPAGSPEGVIAAVQNGADAVYFGFGDYNARRNAKNFSEEEFQQACEYCRIRGVKVHLTLNTLASDRELPLVVEHAVSAARYGADAIIVQDFGVMQAVRRAIPNMPVHASTQMSVHNLEGVKLAAAMGASRVVLARELSKDDLTYICKNSPIETEMFVHGALCMCYSGQCYMSSVIGRRSGNRGVCAQPCRLNYTTGGKKGEYLLSLKDNSLLGHIQELESCGVTCVKIEGRMRRPEYVAIVTEKYARAAHEGKVPTRADLDSLKAAFSRQGFTDGYYTGKTGPGMFGIHEDDKKDSAVIFATARKNYLNGEFQRVPAWFVGTVRENEPAKIAATDDRGNTAITTGAVPEMAFHKETTSTNLQTQLHKTGGTPFYCAGVKSDVDDGLSLSAAAINEMRRTLIAELIEKRKAVPPPEITDFIPGNPLPNREQSPVFTVSILKKSQLSREMADLSPKILYVPAEEFKGDLSPLTPFLTNPETQIAVTLPRVIHDSERDELTKTLLKAAELGVTDALVGNIGHILYARGLGFNIRGDFGMNIFNSYSLNVINSLGLVSQALSFELRLSEIRDLSKSMDTELIVYGRLPLMVTKNCIVKTSMGVCACDNFSGIMDKTGASFPVVKEFGCRNVVLNSKKLYMADKLSELGCVGLWGLRLSFTTENARECTAVYKSYLGLGDYEHGNFTRGLYYRGVE